MPREGGAPNEEAIDAAMPMANRAVSVLDALLDDQPYFAGAKLSLADLHAAPVLLYLSLTPEGDTLLDGHPRLRGWLETMLARPSAARTRCRFGY